MLKHLTLPTRKGVYMELYPHNQITYQSAVEMLSEYSECCIVQCMGTGKTFITMELLNTLFKGMSVLYVVPAEAIEDSLKLYDEWVYPEVVFSTYSNLKNITKSYDVVILDELHRAGATTWNVEVLRLKALAKYVLGLTATPYRFLDNKRDMATELFGEHVVFGPDIQQAVDSGILSGFDYTAILSDVEEYTEEIMSKNPPSALIQRVRNLRLDEYSLGERIKQYITPERRKWIIFYPNTTSLEQGDIDLRNWFGDGIKIFAMHSKQSKRVNKQMLSDFNACKDLCIIKVVDMFNEGAHPKGVNAMIMARRTVSGNVFIQQIGRILSASHKGARPLILDIVENFNNIKVLNMAIPKARMALRKGQPVDKTVLEINQVLISYDEIMLELDDILAKVNDRWAEWEDIILRTYYMEEGADAVYARLDNKTKQDCIKRAKILGISRPTRWTDEEDEILRRCFPSEREGVWRRLPGRNNKAITARAKKLGIIPMWTAEKDLLLMRYYEEQGLSMRFMLPDHTLNEIVERAKRLGLQSPC